MLNAGIRLVKGSGLAIAIAQSKQKIPNNDSAIFVLKKDKRGLENFSIFIKITFAFLINDSIVLSLTLFFLSHVGIHGYFAQKIICIENIIKGIAAIVVEPGGSGIGMHKGREKISIIIPNPFSPKYDSISIMVIRSCGCSKIKLFNILETL